MKKLLIGLAATLLLITFSVSASAGATEWNMPENLARSAVHFVMSADKTATCSAVVVARDYALTAKHCTGAPGKLLIENSDNGIIVVTNVEEAGYADVVLLKAPGLLCPCVENFDDADGGVKVFSAGYPMGSKIHTKVISWGVVQEDFRHVESINYKTSVTTEYVVTTALAIPGSSGGGMFKVVDDKLYLVGIVVEAMPGGAMAVYVPRFYWEPLLKKPDEK